MKAVIVLSGGQDSATSLALAVKRYGAKEVAAITFTYSQRHAIEVEYARKLAKRIGVENHNFVSLDFYSSITENALMSKDRAIKKIKGSSCPTSVVEGRNSFFLLSASVWAKKLGATEVWTGVSEADYSGYPDCREKFIKSQQRTIRLALEWPIKIVTPFMHMTKAQEWALADELGILEIIENETVTCYNGIIGKGCSKCPACRLRNAGYREFLSKRKSQR
jgi:7-cyano-7-deazaguanine synthase